MTQYLTAGLGIACAILTAFLYLTYNMLQSCNSQRAALQQQVATLEDKLDTQNKAIEVFEKAGKDAQDRARMAVEASRTRSKSLVEELGRLKARLKDRPVTNCPAGEAVSKIRQGLNKNDSN